MRIKIKSIDVERMRPATTKRHRQIFTAEHARQFLASSIHVAMKEPAKSAMRMLLSQQLLAERWEAKMRTSVANRRKNYVYFSYYMEATESSQKHSMDWFRRHVLLINSKMTEIERRADELVSAVVNVRCVEL
jgi:beta-glucosidase/6-phospho-beta-glucosidase/beta-galactosidase